MPKGKSGWHNENEKSLRGKADGFRTRDLSIPSPTLCRCAAMARLGWRQRLIEIHPEAGWLAYFMIMISFLPDAFLRQRHLSAEVGESDLGQRPTYGGNLHRPGHGQQRVSPAANSGP